MASLAPSERPDQLGIDERPLGSRTVVRLTGELDISSAERLEALLAVRALQGRHVLVDIDQLEFLDSFGLQAILVGYAAFGHGRGSMLLSRGADSVRRVLEIAGVAGEPPFRDTASDLAL
jgi:anti-sigma B factor antagonist